MRKPLLYLLNFIWLAAAFGLVYYLLIQDHTLHLSIPDLMTSAENGTKNHHLFIIGILPIYLGLIIFGASLLFFYLRPTIWPLLSHYLAQWFGTERNSL